MATTLLTSFAKFQSNLEITDIQSTTVSSRQNRIRNVLIEEIDILESFLGGSYKRDTMIAPLNLADVDIFFVLDPKYYYDYSGAESVLNLIVRTLKDNGKLKTPKVSRNGQAVTIKYSDFLVDVVPCFYWSEGGYIIPNSSDDSWIRTDPNFHTKYISELNSINNSKLVPLIKMIKYWNREHGDELTSFHVEVLIYTIFGKDGYRFVTFQQGITLFFYLSKDLIKSLNPDPSGYNQDVGAYISNKKALELSDKLLKTYEKCNRALICENEGLIEESINSWKSILGPYFPSYG